jgi:hypothetical protein
MFLSEIYVSYRNFYSSWEGGIRQDPMIASGVWLHAISV